MTRPEFPAPQTYSHSRRVAQAGVPVIHRSDRDDNKRSGGPDAPRSGARCASVGDYEVVLDRGHLEK